MRSTSSNPYRGLPSVNEVVEQPLLASLVLEAGHGLVVRCAREVLSRVRSQICPEDGSGLPGLEDLAARVKQKVEQEVRPRLQPVINATGIILHTGLGRSPLADSAIDQMVAAGRHYASLELELATGRRGKRTSIVRDLLCEITGAESATVVNNNAAATLIALATVGLGKDILVSRGELIEIGGSFRLPEIMEASGARLREVGTTNKTRLADYERAIDDTCAGIMKVHQSNYRISGFTESVGIKDLVALGGRFGLPVIDDIGSGALIDFGQFGFSSEPVAARSVALGADLVLFSGDKLAGGPQAGIIAGRREWVERIESHPLMRAFRLDKLILAALEATLRCYRDQATACREIPVLRMLTTSCPELRSRAETIRSQLQDRGGLTEVAIDRDTSYLGGGSIPQQGMETVVLRLRFAHLSESRALAMLRGASPPIVARAQEGYVTIDLRTVFPAQDAALIAAIRQLSESN